MDKSKRLRRQVGVAIFLLILSVSGFVYLVMIIMDAPPPVTEKVVRQITVLQPPPPPPPPPEVEKPPEPEIEEKIEEPEPEPEPEPLDDSIDEPPPIDDLGLDAEGVAGQDGFGLRGRKGGRGLLEGGGGRFQWYAGLVRRGIEDRLLEHDDLRRSSYSVVVLVWVDRNGNIRRYEIQRSSGEERVDSQVRVALGEIDGFSEMPPEGMPQPIKLRIRSSL